MFTHLKMREYNISEKSEKQNHSTEESARSLSYDRNDKRQMGASRGGTKQEVLIVSCEQRKTVEAFCSVVGICQGKST